MALLSERLVAMRHNKKDTPQVFCWAATKISRKLKGSEKNTLGIKKFFTNNSVLFFHLMYQPKDMSRKMIHNMYKETCATPDARKECFKSLMTNRETQMKISGLTVAYSGPKHLRDCLVQSRLIKTSKINVKTSLLEVQQTLQKTMRGILKKQLVGDVKTSSTID